MPSSDLKIPPGWLRIKSSAKYANVSERTIREWFKMGLKRSKVKGVVLIKTGWLDKWLERFVVRADVEQEIEGLVNKVLKGLPAHGGG